jgi:hypothetical protein
VGWESVAVQRIPQKRIFVPDLEKTGPWNAAETTQSRREASGFRLQASGFREQPNSQTARTIEDNRPTVNSQDDWGQSPEDAQHKTLADLAQASGSDSTQHKTLHAAQRNQTTPKSKVVCSNMHQSRREAGGWSEQPNSQDDWGQSPDGKGMLERVKRAAVWLLS